MKDINLAMDLAEQGYLPDSVISLEVHRLMKQRLKKVSHYDCEQLADSQNIFIQSENLDTER